MSARRIAVVGSRHYPDLERVRAYVASLPAGTVLITGGASGVDSVVAEAAAARGLAIQRLAPRLEESFDASRATERNQALVGAAEALVAFWDGKSSGTRLTIDRALSSGREVHVYTCAAPI
jgi:predicted Rossmann fold nucleotide-binding protein DprA/Smf involved in DNA uptake